MAPANPASKELLQEQLRGVFLERGYDGATLAHLSDATGLSKATLYHHFPGGKAEIAATLVRSAISQLQLEAFQDVGGNRDLEEQLAALTTGFSDYVDGGEGDCLLTVIRRHRAANDDTEALRAAIASQFADWQSALVNAFVAAGYKKKRARRAAQDFFAGLYGALAGAKMHADPDVFLSGSRRLLKRYSRASK